MGEFLRMVLGFFVAGIAGGVLGGFVVYVLAGRTLDRSEVEPASIFDSIEEETGDDPVIVPELATWFTADECEGTPAPERVVASRPMSAMSVETHLEERTVRIRIRREGDARTDDDVAPWWAGPTQPVPPVTRDVSWGKHHPECQADSRLRAAGYLTIQLPVKPWQTGEYEQVGGAA